MIMTTKLTLSINKRVIDKAKKYAKNQGRSLSSVVENYLKTITLNEEASEEELLSYISPRIRSLIGIARNLPRDKDYKELLSDYLSEKYLK
jgi:hypothetical protein